MLTVQEVADTLRVGYIKAWKMIRSGEIPSVRVGRKYRIRDVDLQWFLTPADLRDPPKHNHHDEA
jgi:excisionase family DNA binding protein